MASPGPARPQGVRVTFLHSCAAFNSISPMFFHRIPRKTWYEKAVERVFRDRKLCEEKLLPFGCVRGENGFLYRTKLLNGRRCMEFEIHADGSVCVAMHDADGRDIRHSAREAADKLQERALRREYEEELWHVAECCFEPDFFHGDPARSLVAHVREVYGDKLEFLWRKSPGSAIVRRKDTEKWYAVFLAVPRLKLGGSSKERVEVLNLRVCPGELDGLVDHRSRFPAYHMNKKSWVSLCLDRTIPFEELAARLEASHRLAGK